MSGYSKNYSVVIAFDVINDIIILLRLRDDVAQSYTDAVKAMDKILLILTGGTICSAVNADGKRAVDSENAKYKIIDNFRKSGSPFSDVPFDTEMPIDTLSENMTIEKWNILLNELRGVDADEYKGIIILHGTDTLAYTACLLSLVMSEKHLPVCLVSSHSPVDDEGTNANINFRAAVELIMNGIKPNVYAVYQNSDNKIYVHYGAHLIQCASFSNDFYSADAMLAENAPAKAEEFETQSVLPQKIDAKVLMLTPYVGIDYGCISVENYDAVLHTTYHSETVCTLGDKTGGSVLYLAEMCRKSGTDLFLAPCNPETYAYETTGTALSGGIYPVADMTAEMAYIKLLLGISSGKHGNELAEFMAKSINHEKICHKS